MDILLAALFSIVFFFFAARFLNKEVNRDYEKMLAPRGAPSGIPVEEKPTPKPPKKPEYLFTYGTLMQDFPFHWLLKQEPVEYVGLASVKGTLYDCGWFPGLRHFEYAYVDRVHGELYRITDPGMSFSRLDSFEGVAPKGNKHAGLFQRRALEAQRDGNDEKVLVWTYELITHPEGAKTIKSGMWNKE